MAGDATAPGDANQISVPHYAAMRLQFLPGLQSEDERFVLRVDQQDEVAVARQRGAVHAAIVAPWRRPPQLSRREGRGVALRAAATLRRGVGDHTPEVSKEGFVSALTIPPYATDQPTGFLPPGRRPNRAAFARGWG